MTNPPSDSLRRYEYVDDLRMYHRDTVVWIGSVETSTPDRQNSANDIYIQAPLAMKLSSASFFNPGVTLCSFLSPTAGWRAWITASDTTGRKTGEPSWLTFSAEQLATQTQTAQTKTRRPLRRRRHPVPRVPWRAPWRAPWRTPWDRHL